MAEENGLTEEANRLAEAILEASRRQQEGQERQAEAQEHAFEELARFSKDQLTQMRLAAEKAAEQHGGDPLDRFAEIIHNSLLASEHGLENEEELHGLIQELHADRDRREKEERRRERIRKSLEIAAGAGRAGAAGLRGLGRGARKGAGAALRGADRAVGKTSEIVAGVVSQASLWNVFLYTLAVHIGVILNYSLVSNAGTFLYLLVLLLIPVPIMYAFWNRNQGDAVRTALILTVLTVILYLIPAGISGRVSDDVQGTISFLVLYLPPWPLYCAGKLQRKSPFIKFLLRLWEIGLVFVLILTAVQAVQGIGVGPFAGLDFGGPADVLSDSVEYISDLGDRLAAVFTGTQQVIERVYNPSYYTGQIEENEQVPLGVEFEDFRTSDDTVGNESPFYAFGTIRARPIESENYLGESVLVRPACYIEKADTTAAAVDPVEMEIVWGTFGTFECEFPPIGKRGSYTVTGAATFPFQTWAYIEYTFVDDERVRNIARQGLDLSEELDIRQTPRAIYTGGPVALGMGGTPQPVRVRMDEEEMLPPGTRLGITLDPRWRNGEIGRVERLEIKTPPGFGLAECDRDLVHPDGTRDGNEDDYTTWEFENPDDDIRSYESVTCKLVLDDRDEAARIAGSEKAVRTFVAVAHYTYTIEDEARVQVR